MRISGSGSPESSSLSGGREQDESPRLSSSTDMPVMAHIVPQRRAVPRFSNHSDPWWKKLLPIYSRPVHQNSGMYQIISMSDERLQPRRTWLSVMLSFMFVSALVAIVFILVPRGVSVGSMTFVPHNWHRKSDHGTYTLQLDIHMPVYNANYYSAKVFGSMEVLFLDVKAGSSELHGMTVDARTTGQELHFCMDASGVPLEYSLSIIQECLLYPRKLMFICRANLTATTILTTYRLPTIDTYFMVNCYDEGKPHEVIATEESFCGKTSDGRDSTLAFPEKQIVQM